MAYGIIDNSMVVNAVEANYEFAASQGWPELPEGVGIGWRVVDGEFLPPEPEPEPVPSEVSAVQAKTALYQAGLYDQVEAILGGSDYAMVRIWWSSAQVWQFDHPYILGMATELGLTDGEVDDLFEAAAAVET